ncbi:unnamed protein product [Darwinula stevensoni]|uniref:Uncharacterized protein n=1 Tax=Darwinula stevensoni TaxID=69355 RepID=A0A7R8X8H1_9CRUS|nr:unnamed protein product [Darwinula stevensoni]CAG0890128.1 unnamed protein product [Darwinula stevensoni]
MGGVLCTGKDNDELVDNLIQEKYIRTSLLALVFRAVDRAHYFAEDHKERAYQDTAWKFGNLHLSSPCIYAEVLEGLHLRAGLSFLNIGSGTGYLSTLSGLLLGSNGINHGIELHEDVVEYARKKLQDFMESSPAIDMFSFCQPSFVTGKLSFAESSLDQGPGGILVMPIRGQLMQIKRCVTEGGVQIKQKTLLPVAFAPLILPDEKTKNEICELPMKSPNTLQELCRFAIRHCLRLNFGNKLDRVLETQMLIEDAQSTAGAGMLLLRKRKIDRKVPQAKRPKQDSQQNTSSLFPAYKCNMVGSIASLPLPHSLKSFLNYGRQF